MADGVVDSRLISVHL